MRFNPGNQVGAGDEPGVQGGAGQRAGGFQIRRGDEDEGEGGGGLHFLIPNFAAYPHVRRVAYFKCLKISTNH